MHNYRGNGTVLAAMSRPGRRHQLGQRVQHGKFGEGVVLKFEGAGDSARVQVNFSNAGTKWLVVSFANLQAA
jgi:DNA helicase-2/ATP-dependent DNA helicase PcrA